MLIEERDEILENLEIAETRYISSFRLSTPEPSIADLQPAPVSDTEGIPYISRPKALNGTRVRPIFVSHSHSLIPINKQTGFPRRRRARNPAYASSSLTPTSYLAPSQYYKLGSLRGVNGGRFASSGTGNDDSPQSFSDSITQRVVGSRFAEIQRSSADVYGPVPVGSRVHLEGGVLSTSPRPRPSRMNTAEREGEGVPPIPNPSRHGPNWVEHSGDTEEDKEWVDLMKEAPIDFGRPEGEDTEGEGEGESAGERDRMMGGRGRVISPPLVESPEEESQPEDTGMSELGVMHFGRRPKIFGPSPSDQHDTFPLRSRGQETSRTSDVPPPHLRLQAQPPFVRPMTGELSPLTTTVFDDLRFVVVLLGLDHDALGEVYANIRTWRTKLKQINQEIMDAQSMAYNDIADGERIKGWILIGKGLRFIPGVQLIEGRAKEDIRWDQLQLEHEPSNQILYWTVTAIVIILLGIGCESYPFPSVLPATLIDQARREHIFFGFSSADFWVAHH